MNKLILPIIFIISMITVILLTLLLKVISVPDGVIILLLVISNIITLSSSLAGLLFIYGCKFLAKEKKLIFKDDSDYENYSNHYNSTNK